MDRRSAVRCAVRLGQRVAALVVVRPGNRGGEAVRPCRLQLRRVETAARVGAADLIEIPFASGRALRVLILIERGDLVAGVRLRRHLGELLVALAGVVERLEAGPERVQELQVERQPADADPEVRVAKGAERPDLVLADRSAQRDVPLVDRLAGRRAAGRDAILRVVAVPVELGAFGTAPIPSGRCRRAARGCSSPRWCRWASWHRRRPA